MFLSRTKRVLSRRSLRTSLTLALWSLPLVGLEAFGRVSPSDAFDILGVLGLLAWVGVLLVRHEEVLTRRAKDMAKRPLAIMARWRVTAGIDFRSEPRLATRLPFLGTTALGTSILTAGAIAWGLDSWPTRLRDALQSTSGLLLLILIGVLWIGILAFVLFSIAIPHMILDANLEDSSTPQRRRRVLSVAVLVGQLALVAVCMWLFDALYGLVLILASYVVHSIVMLWPGRPPWRIAWRYPAGVPCWCGAGTWIAGMYGTPVAVIFCLVFASHGDRIGTDGVTETAVTGFLGLTLVWSAAIGGTILFVHEAKEVAADRWSAPSRPVRLRISVEGSTNAEDRRLVRRAWKALRARVAFRPGKHPCQVRVVLADRAPDRADIEEPSWPLVVGRDEFEHPELHTLLRRRDEVLRRRDVAVGLRELLDHAGGRVFQEGQGFWIMPHLWFISRMARDTDEGDCWFVGRPFRRVFSRAARSHMAVVMRSADLDILFLEDGVAQEQFEHVLDRIFQHHDLFGERIADERFFSGIVGVRVMIHDLDPQETFLPSVYPEPDYDELARARILEIFRDRGGGDSWNRLGLRDGMPVLGTPLAPI